MFLIGLIGGMGSGKSSVRQLFEERGVSCLDLDALGHRALEIASVQASLCTSFGKDICEQGSINRSLLASRAFANNEATQTLNACVAPAIRALLIQELSKLEAQGVTQVVLEISAYDGPNGSYDLPLNAIVAVTAPLEIRIERLVAKGFTAQDAQARIERQVSDELRLQWADYCIDNSTSLKDLEFQVDSCWTQIQEQCCKCRAH